MRTSRTRRFWIQAGERGTPGGSGRNAGAKGLGTWRLVRYADLCRARDKSAYADSGIMPTVREESLVGVVNLLTGSA
jgi:hypothetical protein